MWKHSSKWNKKLNYDLGLNKFTIVLFSVLSLQHNTWNNHIIRRKAVQDIVSYACNDRYTGDRDGKFTVWGQSQIKARPFMKSKLKLKGLGVWLKW
jgi:hypothetical protein